MRVSTVLHRSNNTRDRNRAQGAKIFRDCSRRPREIRTYLSGNLPLAFSDIAFSSAASDNCSQDVATLPASASATRRKTQTAYLELTAPTASPTLRSSRVSAPSFLRSSCSSSWARLSLSWRPPHRTAARPPCANASGVCSWVVKACFRSSY